MQHNVQKQHKTRPQLKCMWAYR